MFFVDTGSTIVIVSSLIFGRWNVVIECRRFATNYTVWIWAAPLWEEPANNSLSDQWRLAEAEAAEYHAGHSRPWLRHQGLALGFSSSPPLCFFDKSILLWLSFALFCYLKGVNRYSVLVNLQLLLQVMATSVMNLQLQLASSCFSPTTKASSFRTSKTRVQALTPIQAYVRRFSKISLRQQCHRGKVCTGPHLFYVIPPVIAVRRWSYCYISVPCENGTEEGLLSFWIVQCITTIINSLEQKTFCISSLLFL